MHKVTAESYRSEGKPFDIELTRDEATVTARVWDMPEEKRSDTDIRDGTYRVFSASYPEIAHNRLFVRGYTKGKDNEVAKYTFSCGASNAKEWFDAISGLIDKLNADYKPKPTIWRSKDKPYDVELSLDGTTLTARTYGTPSGMDCLPSQHELAESGKFHICISCGDTDIYEKTLFLGGKGARDKSYVSECAVVNKVQALDSFTHFAEMIDELNAKYAPPKPEKTVWRSEGKPYDVEFRLTGKKLNMTVHGMPEEQRKDWTIEGDGGFFCAVRIHPRAWTLGHISVGQRA